MLRSDSLPTSPEPVANGLPEPVLRELLQCLRDWLDTQRDDNGAMALLRGLVAESIKAEANSKDIQLREFDAQELAEACDWPEQDDFTAASKKVKGVQFDAYLESRERSVEAFFEGKGFAHAIRLGKHSPRGRHRAKWFLEAYVPGEQKDPTALQPVDQPVEPVLEAPSQQIEYGYSEAGTVKSSYLAHLLLGKGSFKVKSARGLLFACTFLVPGILLLLLVATGGLHLLMDRPLRTADLAFAIFAFGIGWFMLDQIRTTWWLLEDRIIPAPDGLVRLTEEPAQLESFKVDQGRVIGLVRYTANCPVCAAAVELRYGQGHERRRLFGCCVEAAQEHLFTFDRVTRRGTRVR
ncbi:hypothetical protein [Acidovorax sp. A1169]|uniref:hypothetical protein n=1 Tax=Acidovorax sp. A1169 TaxID=3059524 RepID=UPI002737FF9F|nr:hypothetical protein [Acidovorax sp. A1169]MDP4078797.1 hypothetical protein [Acidovorax sp. A1169]